MRQREAVTRADVLRPNALGEEQKAAWVWDLDNQLRREMDLPIRKDPWPEEEGELTVPEPWEELYVLYLTCKNDYYNGEMDLYMNDRAAYDAALSEWKAQWRREHRPRRKGNWRVMG